MTDAPEWSRLIEAAHVSLEVRKLSLEANESERQGLARRFDLPRLDVLRAELKLQAQSDGVHADGTLHAELAQRCIATGDELPLVIDTPFALRFRHQTETGRAADFEEEVELDASDCDTIDYPGSQFDLGEALSDTLYLALDPFPRGPNAEAALKAAGVKSEGEAGPFGALAELLKKG